MAEVEFLVQCGVRQVRRPPQQFPGRSVHRAAAGVRESSWLYRCRRSMGCSPAVRTDWVRRRGWCRRGRRGRPAGHSGRGSSGSPRPCSRRWTRPTENSGQLVQARLSCRGQLPPRAPSGQSGREAGPRAGAVRGTFAFSRAPHAATYARRRSRSRRARCRMSSRHSRCWSSRAAMSAGPAEERSGCSRSRSGRPVSQIARMTSSGLARMWPLRLVADGVAGDHRFLGGFGRFEARPPAGVGDVDDHANAVHLLRSPVRPKSLRPPLAGSAQPSPSMLRRL